MRNAPLAHLVAVAVALFTAVPAPATVAARSVRGVARGPARVARVLGIVISTLAATVPAVSLPPMVNTQAMTFTGIGDTIAAPGATAKGLPQAVATTAITFTGIGDTIAPPGATRKLLPAQVNTEAILMTGIGG